MGKAARSCRRNLLHKIGNPGQTNPFCYGPRERYTDVVKSVRSYGLHVSRIEIFTITILRSPYIAYTKYTEFHVYLYIIETIFALMKEIANEA